MSTFYLPSRTITRALAESRPQHVPFKMLGSPRRQKKRHDTVSWITKARKLSRRLA